jgi:hypothetical protein
MKQDYQQDYLKALKKLEKDIENIGFKILSVSQKTEIQDRSGQRVERAFFTIDFSHVTYHSKDGQVTVPSSFRPLSEIDQ